MRARAASLITLNFATNHLFLGKILVSGWQMGVTLAENSLIHPPIHTYISRQSIFSMKLGTILVFLLNNGIWVGLLQVPTM